MKLSDKNFGKVARESQGKGCQRARELEVAGMGVWGWRTDNERRTNWLPQYKVCIRLESNQWRNLCQPSWQPTTDDQAPTTWTKPPLRGFHYQIFIYTWATIIHWCIECLARHAFAGDCVGSGRSLWARPEPNWTLGNRLGRYQARPGNVNVRTNLCPMSFKGAVAVKATAVRSLQRQNSAPISVQLSSI